jgi:hypothetical protein
LNNASSRAVVIIFTKRPNLLRTSIMISHLPFLYLNRGKSPTIPPHRRRIAGDPSFVSLNQGRNLPNCRRSKEDYFAPFVFCFCCPTRTFFTSTVLTTRLV